ncbi:MAG: ATP-binding protein [Theionarchaea archaeon]|nr:ATP-binding protein [Theionarchaea archaeon]MBU7038131.1 ATP-binding protein [Theionarchaea archaeon]
MSENPFNFTRPAQGDNFYNRKEETKRAFGFIRSSQSFSIIGERRIGKTSFLQYILSEGAFKKNDADFREWIIVHLSLGSLFEVSKETLVQTIIKNIEEKIKIGTKSGNVFGELNQCMRELALKEKKIIIALDEFEIAENILDYHFSYWLRSVLEHPNLLAITSSRTTVAEISPNGKASPLFNIFGNLFLDLFSEKEARRMISDLFSRENKNIEQEEISYLTELSGGNPYFIQFLGFNYYEEKKREKKVDQIEFQSKMFGLLKSQFASYWKSLDEKERDFLANPKGTNNPTGHILKRKGFLIEEKGKWKVFSPLFEKFLQSEKEEIMRKKYPFAKIMSLSALLMSIFLSLSFFVDVDVILATMIIIAIITIPVYYLRGR